MNRLKTEKRITVVAALVEGVSINATTRMTGVSKPTILKLLRDLGCACADHHNQTVRGLKPARIECDEIWAFNYCISKNVMKAKSAPDSAGDCWTWTAIDRDTKLMISYLLGMRTGEDAREFLLDLAGRVTNIGQLTTDGFVGYPMAVWEAFGNEVDYTQLIKIYKSEATNEARYSPARCVGCKKIPVLGFPRQKQGVNVHCREK